MIFSRPQPVVIFEVTSLFKEASVSSSFYKFLLNQGKNGASKKKGVLYFNGGKIVIKNHIFSLTF